MSSFIRWEDEKIVHIDDYPSFHNHISKQVVHEALKGGRRVGEVKEHDSCFKEALVGDKGSFPFVLIFDMDIIVSPLHIKFGEDFSIS